MFASLLRFDDREISHLHESGAGFAPEALKFNEKTNQQDLEGLAELMTADHTFIDNDCRVTKGKYAMKEGWRDFFAQYPDYRNASTA
jgi:hypothetical protein